MRIQINRFFIDRIFLTAIVLSMAWHIFWLSAVKVVIMPKEGEAAKFPRVSFLGPILGKGALEVQITPRQYSFAEKRFYELSKRMKIDSIPQANVIFDDSLDKNFYSSASGKLRMLIKGSISGAKVEPLYGAE